MRVGVRTLLVLVCVIAGHSVAWAQATIAGAVRDSSGAVLPGVTVEAASPVLIEKVRTAVSDGNGRYRIEDLGSTNRTFLNGEDVTRADLRDGDQISIGSNALKFFLGASVEARYHDELIDLAIYDSLTGFYNRRHFRSMLDDELKKCADDGVLSLLMLDLDYFKAINDQHGHLVGDQVLTSVADILRARAPAGAFIGRLGGEEFAIVLRDTGLQAAIGVAELLRVAIGTDALVVRDKQLRVTVSAGVAECAGRGGVSSDLLRAADQQLYRAKQSGRDRVSPEK